jgi:hypothetical protein
MVYLYNFKNGIGVNLGQKMIKKVENLALKKVDGS